MNAAPSPTLERASSVCSSSRVQGPFFSTKSVSCRSTYSRSCCEPSRNSEALPPDRIGGTEEIEAKCRLIAASNGSFEDALSEGRFREDLFYRLNVLRINIPPLRERGDDRLIMARHFMEQISHEMGMAPKPFSPGAADILRLHNWPGNIREMKNVVQRAIVLSDGPEIDATHLSIFERDLTREGQNDDSEQVIQIPAVGMSLDEIEAEALRITLRMTGGNRSAAARVLGISRPTIHRKIRDYGLEEGV